jgi:hypothetical protein
MDSRDQAKAIRVGRGPEREGHCIMALAVVTPVAGSGTKELTASALLSVDLRPFFLQKVSERLELSCTSTRRLVSDGRLGGAMLAGYTRQGSQR